MAELFSPLWSILRHEITDLEKYRAWDFSNSISTSFIENFSGDLKEVKQRVKELMADESAGLVCAIPPRVKYQYKLQN